MTGQGVMAVETYRSPPSNKRRGFFSSAKSPAKQMVDSELKIKCQQMVDALTDDEREHAARASYKYLWKSVTSKDGPDTKELKEDREYDAMQMAMRHLVFDCASKPISLRISTKKRVNATPRIAKSWKLA